MTDWWANKRGDRGMGREKLADGWMSRQTDRQNERKMEGQTDRLADKGVSRLPDGSADRHTGGVDSQTKKRGGRQTDKLRTDKKADRQLYNAVFILKKDASGILNFSAPLVLLFLSLEFIFHPFICHFSRVRC